VGAAAAALGALILGEYEFNGATPYLAGLLFGIAIAEVILAVARASTRPLAVVAAVETGLGVLWAAWISSGRGLTPIQPAAYAGIVLGVVVGGVWTLVPTRRR
jgi:hypothetical protein